MGIFSRPKGTLIEMRPEWDPSALAFGGASDTGAGGTGLDFSLFNNGTVAGASLFVYALMMSTVDAFSFSLYYDKSPGTNLIGDCLPLISGGATPPGQIFKDVTAAAAPASALQVPPTLVGSIWHSNFPIAIVRPTWRLIVQDLALGDVCSVSFYYRWARF